MKGPLSSYRNYRDEYNALDATYKAVKDSGDQHSIEKRLYELIEKENQLARQYDEITSTYVLSLGISIASTLIIALLLFPALFLRHHSIHIGYGVNMDFYLSVTIIIPTILVALHVGDSSINRIKTMKHAMANLVLFILPSIAGEAATLIALTNHTSYPLIFCLSLIALVMLGVALIVNAFMSGWYAMHK